MKWLQRQWGEYELDCYLAPRKATHLGFAWFLLTVPWRYFRWHLWQWFLETICEYRGHSWVDESYGNPESGCMAGHCNRCGYSFHHTLY
jgi:hypothetical protein